MTAETGTAAEALAPIVDETSRELYARATAVTPGGVNSPVRAMRSVGRSAPLFLERGAGSRVWDEDGNRFTDWVLSWGALPLGHANPAVVAAAERALRNGSTFGAPTRAEVELAELVVDSVPSVQQVRFTSSGTEATMSAVRVARAATGRDAILTFHGCYHGHADTFLATGGSGMATLSIPSSPGVPAAVTANTLVARYNDLDAARALVAESKLELAAIIVEPIAANMGVVPPQPGFLEGLREYADELGALLIFDEVISGFRIGPGGAQEHYGVRPDLSAFGKIVGGGMPCGAFGGRAELMGLVAPAGPVYQAGTLSGNPLAMAAGLATLHALRSGHGYAQLEATGAALEREIRSVIAETGAHADVARAGSLVTLFHLGAGQTHAPRDFDEALQLDTAAFGRTHAGAVQAGHLLPPSQFEALFVSTEHSEADVHALGDALRTALDADDTTLRPANG